MKAIPHTSVSQCMLQQGLDAGLDISTAQAALGLLGLKVHSLTKERGVFVLTASRDQPEQMRDVVAIRDASPQTKPAGDQFGLQADHNGAVLVFTSTMLAEALNCYARHVDAGHIDHYDPYRAPESYIKQLTELSRNRAQQR